MVSVVQIQTGLPVVDQQANDFFIQHPYQASPVRSEAAPGEFQVELIIQQQGEEDYLDWIFISLVIWLVGMAILLVYSAVSLLRLKSRLAESILAEGEKNVWLTDHIRPLL